MVMVRMQEMGESQSPKRGTREGAPEAPARPWEPGTAFGPAAHFAAEDLEIGPDKTVDKTVAKMWF